MGFWFTIIALVIGSYFLGSIPFGLIIGKKVRGMDITTAGSGNIGAANVAREVGTAWGIVTLVADGLKGFLPVVVCAAVFEVSTEFHEALQAGVGLAALVGHQFPIYCHRKGGKGVATGLGIFLALSPISCLFAGAVFLALAALTRYVSLGSIVAALSMPLWLFLRDNNDFLLFASMAASLLIVLRHRDNIWRLAQGNERKWYFTRDHDKRSTRRSSSSWE